MKWFNALHLWNGEPRTFTQIKIVPSTSLFITHIITDRRKNECLFLHFFKKWYHFSSCIWTDRWRRPWRMCTQSTGSRRDCIEAFLSTTSAVSPPKPWPSPPTSSWSSSSTSTSRRLYTSWVVAWINVTASFVDWSKAHSLRLKLQTVGIAYFPWVHWRHQGSQLS